MVRKGKKWWVALRRAVRGVTQRQIGAQMGRRPSDMVFGSKKKKKTVAAILRWGDEKEVLETTVGDKLV